MSELRTQPVSTRSSSTPRKNHWRDKSHTNSKSVDYDSTGESTYSLLSPIYNDSFESDPEDLVDHVQLRTHEKSIIDSSHGRQLVAKVEDATEHAHSSGRTLSAWEKWIICKARQERLRIERKAIEEVVLKETKVQQQREQERRRMAGEGKIHEWLQIKQEQERKRKQLKKIQDLKEQNSTEKKKRESEQKAQKMYKDWLQKKNQEEMEKLQKEKEEAARNEAKARERKLKSEEKFKEWLISVKGRPRPASGYHDSPSPSYCNPIPWKPVHNPPPQNDQKKTAYRKSKKPSEHIVFQRAVSLAFRPKDNLTVMSTTRHSRTCRSYSAL